MLENRQRSVVQFLVVAVILAGFAVASSAMPQAKPATSQAPATTAKAPAKAAPAHPAAARAAAKKAPAKAEGQKEAKAAPAAPPLAAGRRDPFRSLLVKAAEQALMLPPGKKGLVIAQVSIDGIVRGPGGMIAVVSSPQKRTYFLREKDEVYNGHVAKITADGVVFVESAIDPFGKAYTREVTKKLYPVAGEAR